MNRGDGTFEDATARAGVGGALWSASSGFFDADADGDLDLYVVSYVDFAFDNHKWCGDARRKLRSYCHPDVYDGLPVYRNDGAGADGSVRFTGASRQAGLIAGAGAKGLGVAFSDLDQDGTLDVCVTNDSTMNHLYLGRGKGAFEESALFAGVGFHGAGTAEASMGVEIADLDGDGRPEIFLTHLDQESHTLYRANGHIIDNIELLDPARANRQPAQLSDNVGSPGKPRFADLSRALGLPDPLVGRGLAAGDLDRDGGLDLVLTQNGDRALILRNRWGSRGRSLIVRLIGRRRVLVREMRSRACRP